jgi:hypothetical protein
MGKSSTPVVSYIETSIKDGAELVLDGRDIKV